MSDVEWYMWLDFQLEAEKGPSFTLAAPKLLFLYTKAFSCQRRLDIHVYLSAHAIESISWTRKRPG